MKTILVDDERLARKELSNLLSAYNDIEIIAEIGNAEEAIEAIEREKPDVLFLDIQMPGYTGFDLLNEIHFTPIVVFVTAYDEFALKAFEVNALDYMLKPIETSRLEETIEKIRTKYKQKKVLESNQGESTQHLLNPNDQIFLKDGEKCWFVSLKDVRLFESEGNYIRVYFNKDKPLILKSLNNLEDRLNSRVFFRANRKHIVNLKWVKHVEPWFNGGLQLELEDGTKVEVSRRQSTKFKDLMSL